MSEISIKISKFIEHNFTFSNDDIGLKNQKTALTISDRNMSKDVKGAVTNARISF